jgi:hypothetical protein
MTASPSSASVWPTRSSILLSPPPRYITAGCCLDREHTPNRSLTASKPILVSGLERTKKNLESLAEK